LEGNANPDLLERAWSDPQYHFYVEITDPVTEIPENVLLGVLVLDEEDMERRGLARADLMGGLSKKGRRTVLWFFEQAMNLRFKRAFAIRDWNTLPALTVQLMHGMGEAARRTLARLKDFSRDLKAMNLPHHPVIEESPLQKLLDDAIAALGKFAQRALCQPSHQARGSAPDLLRLHMFLTISSADFRPGPHRFASIVPDLVKHNAAGSSHTQSTSYRITNVGLFRNSKNHCSPPFRKRPSNFSMPSASTTLTLPAGPSLAALEPYLAPVNKTGRMR
jgi:hypothetical protein